LVGGRIAANTILPPLSLFKQLALSSEIFFA
jgi:hypothetical protein